MNMLYDAIRVLQNNLNTPHIEVIGANQDIITNILPILFPECHFYDHDLLSEGDCININATLKISSSISSKCFTKWELLYIEEDKNVIISNSNNNPPYISKINIF